MPDEVTAPPGYAPLAAAGDRQLHSLWEELQAEKRTTRKLMASLAEAETAYHAVAAERDLLLARLDNTPNIVRRRKHRGGTGVAVDTGSTSGR